MDVWEIWHLFWVLTRVSQEVSKVNEYEKSCSTWEINFMHIYFQLSMYIYVQYSVYSHMIIILTINRHQYHHDLGQHQHHLIISINITHIMWNETLSSFHNFVRRWEIKKDNENFKCCSCIQVVLGAFLHDIGHLVGKDKGLNQMITDGEVIGIQHHDKVGEGYLRDIGRSNKH